jgi:hypothetical protein
LLGASLVLGVGDSYLASPNWGFTYVVTVPLIVSLMLETVQHGDVALQTLAARGLIQGEAGLDPASAVTSAASRLGAWIVGLAGLVIPMSVFVSVGEWFGRYRHEPIAGIWWSESAAMGSSGAVLQGLLVAAIILFVVHGVAWAQLVHGWTSAKAPLRLRVDADTPDADRDLVPLRAPVPFLLATGFLVQITLYLSNVQHIAEARGVSFLEVVLPLSDGLRLAGLLDLGTGRYPGTVPLVASALVAGFISASLLLLRAAVGAVRTSAPMTVGPWIGMLALLWVATLLVPLGPLALVALIGLFVWQASAERRSASRHF